MERVVGHWKADRFYIRFTTYNKQMARVLRETAQLLEIDSAIIGGYSYEKAAESIGGWQEAPSCRPFLLEAATATSIGGAACGQTFRLLSREPVFG